MSELLNKFAEGDGEIEEIVNIEDVYKDVEESVGFEWYDCRLYQLFC